MYLHSNFISAFLLNYFDRRKTFEAAVDSSVWPRKKQVRILNSLSCFCKNFNELLIQTKFEIITP